MTNYRDSLLSMVDTSDKAAQSANAIDSAAKAVAKALVVAFLTDSLGMQEILQLQNAYKTALLVLSDMASLDMVIAMFNDVASMQK